MHDREQIKRLYQQLKERKIQPGEAVSAFQALQRARGGAAEARPPAPASRVLEGQPAGVETYRYGEPFLKDHTVNGEQVLIGMTHASLAIRAFFGLYPGEEEVRLQKLNFVRPVVVQPGQQVEVRIEPVQKQDGLEFQALYRQGPSDAWNLTATGKLARGRLDARRVDLEQVKSGLKALPSVTRLYADGAIIGFGESFKTVTQLYTGADSILARVVLTPHSHAEAHAYELHPLILNSAFLGMVPLLERVSGGSGFLPFGIKDFVFQRTPGLERCWVLARLVKDSGEMILFDAEVVTDEGRVVGQLQGCSLKRMPSEAQEPVRQASGAAASHAALPAELASSIRAYLTRKLARIVGVGEAEFYDTGVNLMELGLDSVQLVSAADEIAQETDLDLDPTLFFEYPNLRELTQYFTQHHANVFLELTGAGAARPGGGEERAVTVEAGRIEAGESRPETAPPKAGERRPETAKGRAGTADEAIAVIGMHGMFANGADAHRFWADVRDGKELITEIPLDHWDYRPWFDANPDAKDRTYSKWGSFITGVDCFDPGFFSISPREAEWMDPQVRLALQSAYAAAEDAGVVNRLRGSDTGVFIGICFNDYADKIADLRLPVDPYSGTGSSGIAANRISYYFDLTGPSLVINTACSSSLFALHAACNALRNGECGMAFVGGANLLLSSFHYRYFSALKALSPTGRCHTFDEAADGYVPGECVATLLLKPLSQAERDGDPIYAVVKGSAALHGGYSPSLTAPSVAGEENVIVKAWEDAGIDPETITYIEAHGTGTKLGDPVELNSLKKAFGRYTRKEGFCAVGSVKANIGHTEGAAGMAGLIKVILQMRSREIPALAGFKQLNPYIRLEKSPLYINRELKRWEPAGSPLRAGISSFGFSGSYAHVVLEEYPRQEVRPAEASGPAIIALSARNKDRLREYAAKMLAFLRDPSAGSIRLHELSHTLLVGRESMAERMGFIAASIQEVEQKLERFVEGRTEGRELYQGRARRLKEGSDDFAADDDVAAMIEAWVEKGKLSRLLDFWTQGLIPDWHRVYGHRRGPARISLPTYPFAKERYWVPEPEALPVAGHDVARAAVIHPLVHENRSTLTQQCFTTRLSGQEFFLTDHVVNGQKVLPGVAYLEMARVAVEKAAADLVEGPSRIQLKNLIWVRPIVVNEPQTVGIRLTAEQRGEIGFEIYLEPEASQPGPVTVCCQGTAMLVPGAGAGEAVDPEALRQAFSQEGYGAEACYRAFSAIGIDYGPAHRALEAVYVRDHEVLAKLKLPDAVRETRALFTLHPSLMDSALQASIGLSLTRSTEEDQPLPRTSLPFALDRLEVLAPCTASMWARLRVRNPADPGRAGGVRKLDIELFDEAGQLCVSMSGYAARVMEKDGADRPSAAAERPVREVVEQTVAVAVSAEPLDSEALEQKAVAWLRAQLARGLKLPVQRVDPEEPFETYGIDSILVMELTETLERSFGSLSKTLFFEYQTLKELSLYFLESHRAQLLKQLSLEAPAPAAAGKAAAPPAPPAPQTSPVSVVSTPASVVSTPVSRVSSPAAKPPQIRFSATEKPAPSPLDIAIIGLSGSYPQARDLEAYWRNLRDGRDCITEVPRDRWDWRDHFSDDRTKPGRHYSKWGGFIEDIDHFDPLFFQISPREAPYIDPQERLFLLHAWKALEDAGYQRRDLQGDNGQVGVYAGVMYGHYQLFGAEETLRGNPLALSGSYASIANRISYLLNLHGPSLTLDTMCSGSLTTLHLACQDLRHHHTDLAIAGGVNLSVHPNKYLMLSAGQFISSQGHCASFGEGGDGYIPGEGVGVAILKRLADAERDGDHIYAVIKGSAINHGGKTNGYSVPNPNAQRAVIEKALRESGIDPRAISYVEAHGTGTKLGDPIEITGLSKAFGPQAGRQYCWIGSAKSNIGHCESAAGIAGVTKVLLQMRHGAIAPSLHSEILNPNIDFSATPFVVNQSLRAWERPVVDGRACPRIAGVSSFGAGGSNAHMILEEYVAPTPAADDAAHPVIIPLSARQPDRLKQYARDLLRFLQREEDGTEAAENQRIDLADLAYTLQVGREAMEERFACAVSGRAELEEALRQFIAGRESDAYVTGQARREKEVPDGAVAPADPSALIDRYLGDRDHRGLAEAWARGQSVDWRQLHRDRRPRRISAPTYPFAGNRYWLKLSSAAPIQLPPAREQLAPPPEKLEPPREQSALPQEQSALPREPLTPPPEPLQPQQGTLLLKPVWREQPVPTHGHPARLAEHRVLLCGVDGDRRLFQARGISVSTLEVHDPLGEDPFTEVASRLFDAVRQILRDRPRGTVLLQVLIPDHGPGQRFVALSGLLRSAHLENPNLVGQLIQVPAGALAEPLLDRLLEEARAPETQVIRYKKDRRLVAAYEELPAAEIRPTTPLPWREGGVYLITGGGGGLGLHFAREIARTVGHPRLVLTGRSPLNRKLEAEIQALARSGATVTYEPVDVCDRRALEALLKRLEARQGRLNGIIHSAGVIRDGFILKKSDAEFREVLAPKVTGLLNLDQLTRHLELDFFVLFSSTAAEGNTGQADYATANAFMDAYARDRGAAEGERRAEAGSPRRFVSINWPLWREGGMSVEAPVEKTMKERLGLTPLETAAGVRAFYRALASGHERVMVLEGELAKLRKLFEATVPPPPPQAPPEAPAHREVSEQVRHEASEPVHETKSTGVRAGTLEEKALEYLGGLLSATIDLPADQIDPDRALEDYGVDSVMALEVTNAMEEAFGSLSKTLLFEYSSLRALSSHLMTAHGDALRALLKWQEPVAEVPAPRSAPGDDGLETFPLSDGQRILFFLHQLNPESAAYNIGGALRIRSALDVGLLRGSLQALVDRHPILQATFHLKEAHLFQRVHPGAPVAFTLEETPGLPLDELRERVERAQKVPFDLERGPLLRVNLFRRGPEDYVLLISVFHIVFDAWSFPLFMQELWKIYQARVAGRPLELSPPRHRYRDFVDWQASMLKGEEGERHRRYWLDHLSGELPVLKLKTDRPRPPMQTHRGATHLFTVDPDLVRRLDGLAKETRCTRYMVFLAAFQILLHRYTQQERILVGSPMSGRTQRKFSEVLGHFVNTVVMSAVFPADIRVIDFLEAQRGTVLSALEHQDYPFWSIVEQVQPERDPSRSPLFQVMFNYNRLSRTSAFPQADTGRTPGVSGAGLVVEPFEIAQQEGQFDLTLSLEEAEHGMAGAIDFNLDLFDGTTIDRMVSHYRNILLAMVDHPGQPLSTLPFLTLEESRLMASWRARPGDGEAFRPVHRRFEARAAATPEATAAVSFVPGETWGETSRRAASYRTLNERANQLARALSRAGVGREGIVGICLERSIELVVAVMAVLKAGGAFLPIDPHLPGERREFMIEDAGVKLILTQKSLRPALSGDHLRLFSLDGEWEAVSREDTADLEVETRPEDLAYVIYTSGSTGRPKGTLVEHRSWAELYLASDEIYRLEESRRFLQTASFSFDVFALDFIRALCSGGQLTLCPREFLFNPELLHTLMVSEAIDFADLLPAVANVLMDYLENTGQPLTCLKTLVVGSDVFYTKDCQRLRKLIGPETRLLNAYGLTETTIDNLYFEAGPETGTGAMVVPIGRPLPNTTAYVLDAHLQPVPMGVPGELYLGGSCVARGYLNRPDLARQKFMPDPFTRDGLLCRTQDLVSYERDGMIHYIGRVDAQVKIRGYRIEPGEIERVLLQMPQVHEAAVLVKEDKAGGRSLVGYVAATPPVEADQLRAALKEKLPEYMIPSKIILLETMPVLPNGKLDRNALPDPELEASRGYAAPATELEALIAKTWAEALGLKRVGRHDNFFEIGGNSLLCINVISRLKEQRLPVTPRLFFLHSTVAELAYALHVAESNPEVDPIESATRQIERPAPEHNHRPHRIFFVPGLDQNVFDAVYVRKHLGKHFDLHTLSPFDTQTDRPGYASLDALVKGYLRDLKSVQPRGPYHLLAYSWGGKVAIEMVRRLMDAGEEIGFVGLIDAYLDDWNGLTHEMQQASRAAAHLMKASSLLTFLQRQHGVSMSTEEMRNRLQAARGMNGEALLTALSRSIERKGAKNGEDGVALRGYLATLEALERIGHETVSLDFTPPAVSFFSALERDAESQLIGQLVADTVPRSKAYLEASRKSAFETWSSFNRCFEEVRIAANHRTILQEPHVRRITDHIKERFGVLRVDTLTPRHLPSRHSTG